VAARQQAPVRQDRRQETPLDDLVAMLEKEATPARDRTAVFLTSDPRQRPDRPDAQPQALQGASREERHSLHRDGPQARVPQEERVRIEPVGQTFSRVTLRFGYMERPNVPQALGIARKLGWQFDIMSTSFFVSRRKLRPAARSSMPLWQDRLFISLARAANDATDYFQIPTGRVVEVGTQVTI